MHDAAAHTSLLMATVPTGCMEEAATNVFMDFSMSLANTEACLGWVNVAAPV